MAGAASFGAWGLGFQGLPQGSKYLIIIYLPKTCSIITITKAPYKYPVHGPVGLGLRVSGLGCQALEFRAFQVQDLWLIGLRVEASALGLRSAFRALFRQCQDMGHS